MEIPFKNKSKLEKAELKILDEYAWKAICNWHKDIQFDTIYRGVNFNHLIRSFLWAKVSRSIRIKLDGIDVSTELKILNNIEKDNPTRFQINKSFLWLRQYIKLIKNKLFLLYFNLKKKLDSSEKRKKVVFVPIYNKNMYSVFKRLTKDNSIRVVSRKSFMSNVIPFRIDQDIKALEKSWAKELFCAVILGLSKREIILSSTDKKILNYQINQLFQQFHDYETELRIIKPDLVYLYGDNFFPFIIYALVAKKMNIPTFMFQHGLDCEHEFLDNAYASHIAVWGEERKLRYEKFSTQIANIKVTGNPQYSHLKIEKDIKIQGDYIIWFTRPHHPEKCYSVSRSPDEGGEILQTICKFLLEHEDEYLIIKPHPRSYMRLYKSFIENSLLSERITIFTGNVVDILPNAKLVISEDSTMGLESLFYGKLLINVHFTKREPVIPYVKYNAAVKAYNSIELLKALESYKTINSQKIQLMNSGRKRMIKDFAGDFDDLEVNRILLFIEEILG